MSFTPTRLLAFRTTHEGKLDKMENRVSRYPILQAFIADTSHPMAIVDAEVKQGFVDSISRTAFQIPVMNNFNPSIGTARSCTITDVETTSALQNVTTTIHSWGFSIVPAENEGNLISSKRDWNHKYMGYAKAFAAGIETACVAALDTNKSQKENSGFTGPGSQLYGDFETLDQISVSQAQKDDFLNVAKAIMEGNDYYADGEKYNVFASNTLSPMVRRYANQGVSNATNLSFQIPDYDFHFSNRVIPGGLNEAVGYIVPKGQVGLLTRLPYENRQGEGYTVGLKKFGTEIEPLTGLTMGTMYYDDCVDQSARFGQSLGYNTAAATEFYGFNIETALFTPYNSDAANTSNPIFKFAILNP